MKKAWAVLMLLLIALPARGIVPERRKEQFSTEEGYYIVPAPIHAPGLGSALILGLVWNNIRGSHTDLALSSISGDLEGHGLGLLDMHLVDEHLVADLGGGVIRKATVQAYQGRGFDSDPDDTVTFVVGDGYGKMGRLTLTFWERRINFSTAYLKSASRLKGIYDKDGNLIVTPDSSSRAEVGIQMTAGVLDLTDNWYDPRKGLRLSQNHSQALGDDNSDGLSPEQHTIDRNFTVYIPMGLQSTWVFNAYESQAIVTREGLTDPVELRQRMFGDVNCNLTPDPPYCESVINKQIEETIAANKYGTASSLGGVSHLRAFPFGRFKGALTRFYGTEFRWNLTDENTPFDLFLVRDIRTSIQLAFFYERATLAETRADLGKDWRSSKGLGIRMVTGSGLVFRYEAAHGEEGVSQLLFFDYPWSDQGF